MHQNEQKFKFILAKSHPRIELKINSSHIFICDIYDYSIGMKNIFMHQKNTHTNTLLHDVEVCTKLVDSMKNR